MSSSEQSEHHEGWAISSTSYVRGCRCSDCRHANREYRAANRERTNEAQRRRRLVTQGRAIATHPEPTTKDAIEQAIARGETDPLRIADVLGVSLAVVMGVRARMDRCA